MNKLLTKVAKLVLGLSLAAGVGVAVGSKQAQKTEAASDSTQYTLINSTADLEVDKSYIITNGTSGSVKAIATTSNSNNRKTTTVSVSSGKITRGSAVMSFTLGGSTGSWTFATENYLGTAGYLASAASGSNNYLRVIDTAGTATISFSGDAAVINIGPHTSRTLIRYNTSDLFACYSSGQSPIYLWKEVTTSKTLSSISLTGSMTKTSYTTADLWDPTGLVVTAVYSDSTEENVTASAQWTYSPASPNAMGVGSDQELTITASYGGKEDSTIEEVSVAVPSFINTPDLTPGKYFIKCGNNYFTGTQSSGVGGSSTTIPTEDCAKFTFSLVGDDTWNVQNDEGKYLSWADTAKGVALSNSAYAITVETGSVSGTFKLHSQSNNRYFAQYDANPDFRCYTAGQSGASFDLTLETAKTLTTITVSGSLTKTSYTTAEAWDPTGLTVTGGFSDSSSQNLTSSAVFTYFNSNDESVPTPADLGAGSSQTLKVVATVGEISNTTKYVASSSITVTAVAYTNSSSLEEGTYYIKYDTYYFNGTISGGEGLSSSSKPGSAGRFTFTLVGNDTWTVVNGEGNYLGIGSSSTSLSLSSSVTTLTIGDGANGAFIIKGSSNRCVAWYATNSSFRTYVESGNIVDMELEDVNAVEYTITYDSNGGSGTMSSTVGTHPAVASCTFTAPQGKMFIEWNTETNGSGTRYDVGTIATSNLTLYAIWAHEVGTDIVMAASTGGSSATVNGKDAIKCGTGSAGGAMTITLKVANVTKIKAYIAGWKGEGGKTLSVSINNGTVSPTEIETVADNGMTSSTPFTLNGNESDYKYEFTISNAPANSVITISSASKNERFAVWGATDLFAETFASEFNSNLSCNANGTTQPTYTNDYSWAGFEALYDSLDEEEQGILHDAAANESGTSIQQAMARYDYIIAKYGTSSYKNFINRTVTPISGGAKLVLNVLGDGANTVEIIVIISLVSVTAIGGYFFIRRRKVQ